MCVVCCFLHSQLVGILKRHAYATAAAGITAAMCLIDRSDLAGMLAIDCASITYRTLINNIAKLHPSGLSVPMYVIAVNGCGVRRWWWRARLFSCNN